MARDIDEWLEGLRLGRYAKAFTDNEIDLEALPHLTDEDLEKIGVALGARRKMLAAIAALGNTDEPPIGHDGPAKQSSSAEAERRQLTVMFCDMAGSTVLSTRLDPEDYREVVGAYQDACAGVITRCGGYVGKFLGDGVLAYFGWPQAREDDARQAISAGLRILSAVADIATPDGEAPLTVRIGIASGPVVVGDIVGAGAAQEVAVTGETPNLAARLQALAEPDTIVVAPTTHALAGGQFDYEALGPQTLKLGFGRPRPDLVPHATRVYTASFPSGHSMESAVVYLTLGALVARILPERRLRVYVMLLMILLTLIIGLSRIYLGVHWPTDVLAGWAAGSAWALLCWLVGYSLQWRSGNTISLSHDRS